MCTLRWHIPYLPYIQERVLLLYSIQTCKHDQACFEEVASNSESSSNECYHMIILTNSLKQAWPQNHGDEEDTDVVRFTNSYFIG